LFASGGFSSVFTGEAEGLRVSLGVSPAPFGLSQLQSSFARATVPLAIGSAYLSVTHGGFHLYSELCVSAGVGFSIAPLTLGIGVSSFFLTIDEYGSTRSVGVDVGIRAAIAENLVWGASAVNINGATLGPRDGEIPQILATALFYRPSSQAAVALELFKDIHFPLEVHLGLEYRPITAVVFRVGVSTNPSIFSGGFGVVVSGVGFEYAVDVHCVLGSTHHFGLTLLPSAW